MKGIINGKIILEEGVFEDKALLFKKKIYQIINKEELSNYKEIELLDVNGRYVSPGFIDIHIHGSGGSDIMDGDIKSLEIMSEYLTQNGVTGFLPTTMTMDKESIFNALDIIKKVSKQELPGASVLGAHLEGPFINEKRKGAQNSAYILKPDYDLIKDYLDVIRIITIAPEKDEEYEFLNKIKKHEEIVISMGHSNASYEEAMDAIHNGVSHVTHLFNAMTSFHHREPGIVGAAFKSNVTCELITDMIHVHPSLFQLVIDIKGKENVILITDSMRAGCLKEGIYNFGGQRVIVEGSSARLEDGTLAGSILKLNKAVKNLIDNTEMNIHDAVQLVTLNPARILGIEKDKGSLKRGKDADITVFDEELNIAMTIVGGRVLYNIIGEGKQ